LPEWELRQRGDEILRKLGHWLASGNEGKLAHEYEAISKMRFEESVPLHECVRGLCLIKDKMIAFLDNQGIDQDALNLYAEAARAESRPFFRHAGGSPGTGIRDRVAM
jgi:hypothetical protein